ncbi:hypothetical protein [Mycobacterium sp. 852002-51961_SCH5331710]|uniref:hypothetical protein n=1 Tax=Mycobacterium sp. 852002-51961_SCH5331710 TaxID=1834105 RepID=UPI0007FC1924|nr:hypothetical protein [Mycobacterium sp. 852002-51961_SCH5331710]OBB35357.1 hypothetical protein A5752_19600 [Mycobacterium sp. 852002-51961_SCH5331710]
MRRTIQIEFNELSPMLIDEFISAGELPNFRRLRDSSAVFITDASDEINLEPWTQWPTLHSGIADRDHGIQHLGEAHRLNGRGIARELADAGFKVGVFGSMNMDYGPLDGFVVPDPWNPGATPHPARLKAFTDFVVSAVQENSANRLDKRAAVPFLGYLATHGLTPATGVSTVRQLVAERRDPGLKWRRSIVLDAISYDVFRNLVRTHEVAYATFFSNSTAHFQHYFWRNFRPGSFSAPPPPEDHPSLADAVLAGYRNYDQLIGRFLVDFPNDRLIFATALSQKPWDTTKCTYRPKDFDRLLRVMDLDPSRASIAPVMAEEFLLSFSDQAAADEGMTRLAGSRVGEQPLFRFEQADPLRVKVGCAINEWSPDLRVITLPNGEHVPFDDLFYRIHTIRSGRHHPDGCFWVQCSTPHKRGEKIPLTAVAPTVLRLFGVDPPTYMKDPAVELASE